MMSDRHYRSKLKFEEARGQLIQGAGTQFDEEVINKFVYELNDFDLMVQEIAATYE
jgi:HD-GYP domain-containing protein (c-di-GMP phosphodiesterase class II)